MCGESWSQVIAKKVDLKEEEKKSAFSNPTTSSFVSSTTKNKTPMSPLGNTGRETKLPGGGRRGG